MPYLPFRLLACCIIVSLSACSNTTSDGEGTRGPAPDTYQDPGPWEAGVLTLTLADRKVEVWYPVDPDDVEGLEPYSYFIRDELSDTLNALLPEDINPPFVTDAFREAQASNSGPFPLVIFAHGARSYRNQSSVLTAHLASWGFVVASVDYLERGLPSFLGPEPDPAIDDAELSRMVVVLLDSENVREGSLLEGALSTEQIAITGHSAGGGTSIEFGVESDVVTYIPLSAGQGDRMLPDKPSLWLTGTIDGIVSPQATIDAFEAATAPTRLVLIEDMGHLGPSDICAIGEGGGGVVAIALEAGLPVGELERLGTDGCQDEALPVQTGWPLINHFVTAQLLWAFGFNEEPIGLSQDVESFFPEVVFDYDETL
jgi:dienelactone hydrolase